MRLVRSALALVLMSSVGVSIVSTPAQAAPMCLGKRATIVGTSWIDAIYGTSGPDVIVALASQDQIFGGGDAVGSAEATATTRSTEKMATI